MQDSGLSRVAEMMSDIWGFIKRHYTPSNTDEYWNAVTEEADTIINKYNDDFCRMLILACVDDFERRSRTLTTDRIDKMYGWIKDRRGTS